MLRYAVEKSKFGSVIEECSLFAKKKKSYETVLLAGEFISHKRINENR